MLKSILNSDGVQQLSKTEQKSITGGARYLCMCIGSIGAWEGSYSSRSSIEKAIGKWCASGSGTCQALPTISE